MKRRLFGILLSLALAAGMMPALSMTAHAVDHVIQAGSTYEIDDTIYFGDDTPLWIQMDDKSGKELYQSFTGTATLTYYGYSSDIGQHAFTLVYGGTPLILYISDTDSSEPWGIAVTGGDGSSEENAFTFKVLHEEPVDYQLWIKGTQATNWNKDDVLGDGTVSYDPDKGILTLNGADITVDAESKKPFGNTGICYKGDEDLIIDASEASTVMGTEEGGVGIVSTKNITIKGTLTVGGDVSGINCSGSKIIVSGKVSTTGRVAGIYLGEGDITVESGAELTATGNEAAGIWINDDKGTVTVSKGAKLSAVGAEVGAIDAVVKNAIAGTAWTDRTGTKGETDIAVNTAGKRIDKKFKKVQFPALVRYNLWVGGIQATSENKNDMLGDGTVSYDPKAGILTLKGANIKSDPDMQHGDAGIYYDDGKDLIIDATEASTVTAMDKNTGVGITSTENLTLKGTLSASGGICGINCFGNKITVSGKVDAKGGETGIYLSRGDVTISSGADLSAEGGDLAGIAVNDPKGTVTIKKGAKVSAAGGAAGAIDAIVKNAIAGKAWTDRAGTEGETYIAVNTAGEKLDKKFKKAQFPAEEPVGTLYTITFDLNGGTLDGETGTVRWAVEEGALIVLPEPVKEGYIFDYWEGSRHYAGDDYLVTEDHTFRAVWKTADNGGSSKKGVRTGDENSLGAWIVLLLAALTGTTGMAFARKRKGE